MKICPQCQKSYSDPSLNFCLEDGRPLRAQSADAAPLPNTVLINQPRTAFEQQQVGAFGNQAGIGAPPRKSSKTWLWIVAVLGVLVLVCGGGGIALIALIEAQDDSGNANAEKTTSVPDSRTDLSTIDLSLWSQGENEYAKTEFRDGAYVLETLNDAYYYVILAGGKIRTQESSVKVSVRNLRSRKTVFGYGLVFHSDAVPLSSGLAFLIDSERRSYRVVEHRLNSESEVVGWKYSSAIREGNAENEIEIRDEGDKVKCLINGQIVTTITDELGKPAGTAGIYASNAPIAFRKFEIRK